MLTKYGNMHLFTYKLVAPVPSLTALHTFALPSTANNIVKITDSQQLTKIDWQRRHLLLGEGSNTVFIDDFAGDVILVANKGIEVTEHDDSYHVRVCAGENWHQFVSYCVSNEIYGIENLALIPGTVGAAPVQNIGAYGVEVKNFIHLVDGFDIEVGQFKTLSAEQCQFGYRDSVFKHHYKSRFVITHVEFSFSKTWRPNLSYGPLQSLKAPTAQQVLNEVIKIRNSKLPNPSVLPNAGSFFKNPIVPEKHFNSLLARFPELPNYPSLPGFKKLAAGWLIEQSGLKQEKIGGIAVHQQQALVVVNHGQSTGNDLINYIKLIRRRVLDKFNIALEPEVRLIGKLGELTLGDIDDR